MIYKVEALANIRSDKYLNWVEQSSLQTWIQTCDSASNDSEISWGKLLHILVFTETDRCTVKEKNSVSLDL